MATKTTPKSPVTAKKNAAAPKKTPGKTAAKSAVPAKKTIPAPSKKTASESGSKSPASKVSADKKPMAVTPVKASPKPSPVAAKPAGKPPVKAPANASAKASEKPAAKVPAKEAAKEAAKAPSKTPAKTPPKPAAKTPAKELATKDKWSEIRAILLKMKQDAVQEILRSIKSGSESSAAEETTGDIYDQASSERDRELELLLNDREREKVHNIDEALLRMSEGEYGICEECDEDIPIGRLKVLPFTRHCVRCKSDLEKMQAQTRWVDESRTYREIPVGEEDEG